MDQRQLAIQVVESLRMGIPPQRGIALYSVGNDKLIDGVAGNHLGTPRDQGIIRFVSGSWGAGKTHFFRQLREAAFQRDWLVSGVELDVNSTALNKFQTVFAAIVRQIATPSTFEKDTPLEAAPFGTVLYESLAWLGGGGREVISPLSYDAISKATTALMDDTAIDIDVRKMIRAYWETFLPEQPEPASVEQTRGEILQWFSGEGAVGFYRKRFGVAKMISKENAKTMLQSLAAFVRLAGYNGLMILFDEAEQAYSVMRKSALRQAHDNLLSLINNIEDLAGLFLVYATTPDFYTDPKHGIVVYGALAGRIGRPQDRAPKALDRVWNLDSIRAEVDDYQQVALKIREVYAQAYPEAASSLPGGDHVKQKVTDLHALHPPLAAVRFWRLLVTAMIADFDDHLGDQVRPVKGLYDDVMDLLREV